MASEKGGGGQAILLTPLHHVWLMASEKGGGGSPPGAGTYGETGGGTPPLTPPFRRLGNPPGGCPFFTTPHLSAAAVAKIEGGGDLKFGTPPLGFCRAGSPDAPR